MILIQFFEGFFFFFFFFKSYNIFNRLTDVVNGY